MIVEPENVSSNMPKKGKRKVKKTVTSMEGGYLVTRDVSDWEDYEIPELKEVKK